MAGITLAEAEAHLAAAQSALTKARTAKSYSIKDRAIQRQDVKELREEVLYWNDMVKKLDRGGIRVRGVTPV